MSSSDEHYIQFSECVYIPQSKRIRKRHSDHFSVSHLQGPDEQSPEGGSESVELPAEISFLDQHVQCLYHACIVLKISYFFLWFLSS